MKRILYALFALMLIASCTTQKKVPYFQDLSNCSTVETALPQEITIKPGDKLSIHVNSKDEELVAPFNLRRSQQSMGSQADLAYTVDKDGNIEFPYLGSIRIEGMTRDQAAKAVKQATDSTYLHKDMVVDFGSVQLTLSPKDTEAQLDVQAAVDAAFALEPSQEDQFIALLPYLQLNTDYIYFFHLVKLLVHIIKF